MTGANAKPGGHGSTGLDDDIAPEHFAPADAPSLLDDVSALVEDGKVYFEAELAFQKSRAGYVGNRVKYITAYGALALGFVHLALIALAVGAVLSLATLVGPLLATIIVVLALLALAGVLVVMMRGKIRDIGEAFEEPEG